MSSITILSEYNQFQTIINECRNKQKELIDKNIIYKHPEIIIDNSKDKNNTNCEISISITFHDDYTFYFYEKIDHAYHSSYIASRIDKIYKYIKDDLLSIKYINATCEEYYGLSRKPKEIFRYRYEFNKVYEDIKYLHNINNIFKNIIYEFSPYFYDYY